MHKKAAAKGLEPQSESKDKENEARDIPHRCKCCDDLAYCDTDFCMNWWH